jgi:hypothetical protein
MHRLQRYSTQDLASLLAQEQKMFKFYMEATDHQIIQSGLGGSQQRPDVAPEPTFPTDIRASTRSDIGLSADGKAETTSVTADNRQLDEGETVVLAIHPLEIGSSEVGKRGYRQVMEGALV